jgi:hypothetical protein
MSTHAKKQWVRSAVLFTEKKFDELFDDYTFVASGTLQNIGEEEPIIFVNSMLLQLQSNTRYSLSPTQKADGNIRNLLKGVIYIK